MLRTYKRLIILYLIDIIDKSKIIEFTDNNIKKGLWIDEFEDLTMPSFYSKKNLYGLLRRDNFKPTENELTKIEDYIYRNLLLIIHEDRKESLKVQKVLINYFKLKIDILNLSSNETPVEYMTIIEDYDLKIEGHSSRLNLPNDLFSFLIKEICKEEKSSEFKLESNRN